MKTLSSNTSILECPFCESKESFRFKEGDKWMFLCHDCQRYMSFDKSGAASSDTESNSNTFNYDSILTLCERVDSLSVDHQFRKYCEKRHIPLDRVFYTRHFDEMSKYAETPVKDKERLILPFFDEDGKLFGIQGRSLDSKQIRYITIMFDKNKPKLFGLDKIDNKKTITIVEGPIDSFFVENCIAMAGSDGIPDKYKTNSIIAYDNEPRSREIVNKMRKSLEDGYRIVIWPDQIKEKDVNDMILSGLDVNKIIKENTYSGFAGILKLGIWKKVK